MKISEHINFLSNTINRNFIKMADQTKETLESNIPYFSIVQQHKQRA